jgi:hypothetical protein
MNKFAIATIYTKDILPLAVITTEYNKRKYCEKYNYDLICQTKNFLHSHLGFAKIGLILEILKSNKYDWVYWVGSDTMITNYNIPLNKLIDNNYHFIISYDIWDFNFDSFLIRNSPEAIEYFQNIWDLIPQYIDENGNAKDFGLRLPDGGGRAWAEQGALIDLYNNNPKYSQIVKPMYQKFMNSYLYNLYPSSWHQKAKDCKGNNGQWSTGDFLVHWPGMGNDIRLNLAIQFLELVEGANTCF